MIDSNTTFDAQVTFCYCPDLDASAEFYEQTLGLPLVLDQGSCRIYRAATAAYLAFCHRESAPKPEGIILTLVSQDVDGWYSKLSSRGVEFETPPKLNPDFNIYHCFLRDPNGYLIEIQRFDDPAWEQNTQ